MYDPEPMKVDEVEIDGRELGAVGTRWMGTQFTRKVWAIPTLVITPSLSLALPTASCVLSLSPQPNFAKRWPIPMVLINITWEMIRNAHSQALPQT